MVSSISGKEERKNRRKDSLITRQKQLVELRNGLQHLGGGRKKERKNRRQEGRKKERKKERKKGRKERRTHLSQDKSSWLN